MECGTRLARGAWGAATVVESCGNDDKVTGGLTTVIPDAAGPATIGAVEA